MVEKDPSESKKKFSLREQVYNQSSPSAANINNQNIINHPNNISPPSSQRSGLGILSAIGGIFAIIFSIFKFLNSISGTSDNYQSNGRYQCTHGHIEHATHWGGPRKCSICGKTMYWKR